MRPPVAEFLALLLPQAQHLGRDDSLSAACPFGTRFAFVAGAARSIPSVEFPFRRASGNIAGGRTLPMRVAERLRERPACGSWRW